jgi:DNA invertase Pin-like site-specific DNA recombinase
MGEHIGYIRVSTTHQETARQDALMQTLGVTKIFADKLSGKNTARPELIKMLEYVREGDTLIVESFSRLARSTRDLLDIVDTLNSKGCAFQSKKEAIDTSTPTGKFFLTVIAALSELERSTLLERQREGIECAKAAGKYTRGNPKPTDWEQFGKLHKRWKNGEMTAVEFQKKMSMTAPTFYRRIKEYEARH